jgi:osmotically-inducible protein OsmY
MTNDELRASVEAELRFDPQLDPQAIAVAASDGVVTLRGTVGSFRERRQATNAAKRLYGTKHVDNQLDVKLMTEDRREDADLRGAVLQALTLNALVPSTVDADVNDGHVTLRGDANYQFQREEAETTAGNVIGVTWVTNSIELIAPAPSSGNVQDSITRAFERDAKLDSAGVHIESVNGGTVKLSGSVRSWAEHDAAIGAAWAAPGVSDVDDRLLVVY